MRIANVATPEASEELEFLVDSGAVYSVVPASVLERLGIRPYAEQEFRLANATRIVRKRGAAFFRYGDRIGVADVVFGEPDDYCLLGALSLEALGLSLDPLRRELVPMPMILAHQDRATTGSLWLASSPRAPSARVSGGG
jgi:hypothetical protein